MGYCGSARAGEESLYSNIEINRGHLIGEFRCRRCLFAARLALDYLGNLAAQTHLVYGIEIVRPLCRFGQLEFFEFLLLDLLTYNLIIQGNFPANAFFSMYSHHLPVWW